MESSKNGGAQFSALLDAAKRREPAALETLYERYSPMVLRRVRAGLGPLLRKHYDTLDLGQSVFVEVLRDLRRFEDRGERAFRSWLLIKAQNKVRMKLRLLGRVGDRRVTSLDAHTELAASNRSPLERSELADAAAMVDAGLASLSITDRELVVLRARHGLPFATIADRLKLPSADAARMRYARLLVQLKNRWNSKRP